MINKKAIVTIAVGQKHYQLWKKYAEYSWKKYAEKHGYDIICFTEPLDNSERAKKRSAAWQKCLILGREELTSYKQIIWLDSDIIINPYTSPCIVSAMTSNKIGAIKAWEFYTSSIYQLIQNRMKFYAIKHKLPTSEIGKQYFVDYGLPPISEMAVQTGVLVLNKDLHKEILEKVYYQYEDKGAPVWHYEMRPLSYELINADMVEWLDMKFNYVVESLKAYQYVDKYPRNYFERIMRGLKIKFFNLLYKAGIRTWEEEMIVNAFNEGYFIHFAGNAKEMVFSKGLVK